MLRLPRPTRRPRFRRGLRGKANKQELNLEGFIAGKRSDDFYADSANETVEKIQGIKKAKEKVIQE